MCCCWIQRHSRDGAAGAVPLPKFRRAWGSVSRWPRRQGRQCSASTPPLFWVAKDFFLMLDLGELIRDVWCGGCLQEWSLVGRDARTRVPAVVSRDSPQQECSYFFPALCSHLNGVWCSGLRSAAYSDSDTLHRLSIAAQSSCWRCTLLSPLESCSLHNRTRCCFYELGSSR
jgi:hypothetical protein